jgi:2-polyprenyl-6-hydroxyphenyl methylase/3-demethylubiquinone-9 3-methyltransferase
MSLDRKRYQQDHWIRSHNTEKALAEYMDQQSKAYSRVKNAFICEMLGNLEDRTVLDYGCGAGMFLVQAARQGAAKVVGVDAEEAVLATARYFTRLEGVESVCEFIQSDHFPSIGPGMCFDVILIKDVIEHVDDDQGLLNAAAGLINPGGVIIVCTQNSLSLNYLLEGIYERIFRGNSTWRGWDPTHLRFYTPMSLNRKLERAGFRAEAWRSTYIVPHKLPALPWSKKQFIRIDPLTLLDRALGGLFPYNLLGWSIMVKARASSLAPETVPAQA